MRADIRPFTWQDPSAAIIWMRRMLFPNHSDGVEQEGLPQGVFKQEFFDESLNYEQQASLQILSSLVTSVLRHS